MAGIQRGGGETFDLEMAGQLSQMGHDVTFLTGLSVLGNKPGTDPSAIQFRYLRSPYLPWFPWDKIKGGWRLRIWEFQLFEKRALKWIANNADDFDVIQICELPYLVSILKSKIQNPKSKVVMRLTAPNAHDSWGGIEKADGLIASGTSIEKIRTEDREDVHNVPNGVDLKRFDVTDHEAAFRQDHGIGPSIPLLLYVARFQKFKNHGLLLHAFRKTLDQVPEAKLVLVGSGPLQAESVLLANKLNVTDNVIFLGETPFEKLPDLYASADIKVISSEYESFCFAAIEGMAAGLPVVTTDCGWVPGLIGDETSPVQYQWTDDREDPHRFGDAAPGQRIREVPGGLVSARGDAESLANGIIKMVRDDALRTKCSHWNRAKAVKDHGWETSAIKLLDIYHELLGDVQN